MNLPTGLSINSSTGLIAGTISPKMRPSGTPDSVTVAVPATGRPSASQTFTLSVAALGLMLPGALQSVEGQERVGVACGKHRRRRAGHLEPRRTSPAGLSLNTSTGLVSGEATSVGTSLVGVTLSEGSNSVSQSVAWQVAELGLSNPGKQTSQEGPKRTLALQGISADSGSLSFRRGGACQPD